MAPENLILVLRFNDAHGPSEGTIHAHQQVEKRLGYVWFGKLGRPLGAKTRSLLLNQTTGRSPLFLVLATRCTDAYAFYWSPILDIERELPASEAEAVPAYYSKFQIRPNTWFKLSEIRSLAPRIAEQISVGADHLHLLSALRKTQAGSFVAEGDLERHWT